MLTNKTLHALQGQACGDAFGAPFEYTKGDAASFATLSLEEKRYLDSRDDCGGKATRRRLPGLYTDDTQQALLLIYMRLRGIPPHAFTKEARKMEHRGTGRNFRDAVTKLKPVDTAGLGAAMRVGPVATMFDDLHEMCEWVLEASRTTTTNPVALACTLRFAGIAWALSHQGRTKDLSRWPAPSDIPKDIWLLSSKALTKVKEGEEALVKWASETGLSNKTLDVAANGFALTGVAWAVHAASTSDSYTDALQKACASGGDTDTVAAMAGCLSALLHGPDTIPSWMRHNLLGIEHIRYPDSWVPEAENPLTLTEREFLYAEEVIS